MPEAIEGILGEVKRIINEKINDEELRKAKDFIMGNTYLNLETSDSLGMFYGFQEIMREKVKNPKEVEKEIERVTAPLIQKLANEIFVNKNLNLAILGDIKDEKILNKILKI